MDNISLSSEGFSDVSDQLSFAGVLDLLRSKHGWRLDRQIGQGGFAQVYKETIDGIPRAVKVSLHPLAELPDRQRNRELEALEIARRVVGHPHIVGLVGYEWAGDHLVTVWEWADGGSLEDLLRHYQQEGQPGIPLQKLLRYMDEAAKGIDDLNQQGIYHRDVKPANLLLFYDHVKLGDLGLAKLVGASTGTHTRAGTFGYLPPEAWDGKTSATMDLYGLAASYVKLRTGREPFGTTPQEIVDRQRQGQPILDGLTEAEKPWVLAALHPDPDKRFNRGAVAWVRKIYQALKSPPPLPKKQTPQKETPLQEVIVLAVPVSEENPYAMAHGAPAQAERLRIWWADPVHQEGYAMAHGAPAQAEPQPSIPPAPELPELKTSVFREVKEIAIGGAILGGSHGAIAGGIGWAIVGAIEGARHGGIGGAIVRAIEGAIEGAIVWAIVCAIAMAIIGAIVGAIVGATAGED